MNRVGWGLLHPRFAFESRENCGRFDEMFVVKDKPAGSPLSSPDNTAMQAFGTVPEMSCRLMQDATRLATDSASPRTPQPKDDSDSVRSKLCDSLTSALEMVVSKQLVKSVLGVSNEVETVEAGDFHRRLQLRAQDGLSGDRIAESGARILLKMPECIDSLRVDLGFKDDFHDEMEPKTDRKRMCFASLPTPDKSLEQVNLKLNSDRKQESFVSQETMVGVELLDQAKRVARNIELNLLSLNGGVSKKYKEKARSLLFNLKDKSNPQLRARVFDGEITPKILVRMSAEQLASKELTQWRTAKAEEFGSMIVLTEADIDFRRIMKKTHKGECQLVADEIDFLANTSSDSARPVGPVNVEEDFGKAERGYPTSGKVGNCGSKVKVASNSCSKDLRLLRQIKFSSLQERVKNKSSAKEETANHVTTDQGAMDARNGIVLEILEETSKEDDAVVDSTSEAFNLTDTSLNSRGKTLGKLPVSSPDYCTKKLSKTLSNRCVKSGGVASSLSNASGKDCEAAVWEGSIQLSATRFALINGFYESGERLELKDWPRSVEVKGRVRLVVLDKFLQDLQLSRSRTVTILSLCPSECHSDAKQSSAYLKEMADRYRNGGRAGFVEPQPGFELYLLAPSSMSLEPSRQKDLCSIKTTTKRENGFLRGVVVWRKSQPQGLPLSTGPDQNVSVKEVPFSNVVLETNMVDVKPSQCIETPPSQGWFRASQNAASAPSVSYANASSSMDASEPRGNASSEHNLPISKDCHQPPRTAIDHRATTLVSPSSKIAGKAHVAVIKPVSRMHHSIKLQDIPPGFLPRTVQTCQEASQALVEYSDNFVPDCQSALPYPSSVTGEVSSLLCERKEIFKDTPTEFLHQPFVDVPEGKHTVAVKDDDDLPEFNFHGEGVVSQATGIPLLPANPSLSLSRHTHTASESFAGLRLMSDPSVRHYGHLHDMCNLHSPGLDVGFLPGGHPLRCRTHCKDSFERSVTSVPNPNVAGWPGTEGRADMGPSMVSDFPIGVSPSSCNYQTSTQVRASKTNVVAGEDSVSVTPMNASDQRSSQLRVPLKYTVAGEEESCIIGHKTQRVLAPSVPVSLGLPSSQLQVPSEGNVVVAEQFYRRIDFPEQQEPFFLSHAGLTSLPQEYAGHPLHPRHQHSLLHMVVHHQHSLMNRAFNWRHRGVTFPQKKPWDSYRTCNPSERPHLASPRMHRTSDLRRQSATSETYITEDARVQLTKSGREEMGIRDGNEKSGLLQRDQKKRGNITLTPFGEPEDVMEWRETKSLKRGRERERDR